MLGEPAYIVRSLANDEMPIANGLPVFNLYYENDDDPIRKAGTSSRLLFTAPETDRYTVRITDTRGEGGDDFAYRLAIRPADPRFRPDFNQPKSTILKGTGRDFAVRIDRIDGFDGPVTFEIIGLPTGLVSNSPITIEPGQRSAVANIWADESCQPWPEGVSVDVIAHANIGG